MIEEQLALLRSGPPIHSAAAVAILFHGRDRSPEEMLELANRLGLAWIHYIVPEAPDHKWYPQRFTAPLSENEPQLSEALRRSESLVTDALNAGIPSERLILGGFSQGACLTAEFLARSPRHYGAALIFTGALIGPPGTKWAEQPELAGLPIYMSSSANDEWIPENRFRETEDYFTRCGAAVRKRLYSDRPHLIDDEEVTDAREMLVKRFSRLS